MNKPFNLHIPNTLPPQVEHVIRYVSTATTDEVGLCAILDQMKNEMGYDLITIDMVMRPPEEEDGEKEVAWMCIFRKPKLSLV